MPALGDVFEDNLIRREIVVISRLPTMYPLRTLIWKHPTYVNRVPRGRWLGDQMGQTDLESLYDDGKGCCLLQDLEDGLLVLGFGICLLAGRETEHSVKIKA